MPMRTIEDTTDKVIFDHEFNLVDDVNLHLILEDGVGGIKAADAEAQLSLFIGSFTSMNIPINRYDLLELIRVAELILLRAGDKLN